MIELTFLKESMLIRQANQKSVIFVTIGISYIKLQPDICDWCHDVLMMYINFSDTAILNIHGADYRRIISVISKCETINLMENVDFTEKAEHCKT